MYLAKLSRIICSNASMMFDGVQNENHSGSRCKTLGHRGTAVDVSKKNNSKRTVTPPFPLKKQKQKTNKTKNTKYVYCNVKGPDNRAHFKINCIKLISQLGEELCIEV